MSERHSDPFERLNELLAELELGRLDPNERAELDALLASEALGVDVDERFDAVAQDIALTHAALCAAGREELPEHVAERIRAEAARHFDRGDAGERVMPRARPTRTSAAARAPTNSAWFARTGWLVAAAAAIGLIVVLTRPAPNELETRDAFIARVSDEIVVPWTPTADPIGAGITGDVVWSPSEQTGYMRFSGLGVNDPNANQYQLWIIDGARTGEDPVDGGVFDCDSKGEIVVPIDAKLMVGRPAAFAITLEKPGGVVVSEQEHLFLLAAVGS